MQNKVYETIKTFLEERSYPPAVRDISAALGVSTSTVHYHMHRLRRKGRIAFEDGRARTVRLVG